MKLIVTGYGQHGKGEVCKHIKTLTGLKSESSSRVASDVFMLNALKERGFSYATPLEAYADRRNHRELWYRLMHQYCVLNGMDALAKLVFTQAPIYDGLRNRRELIATQKTFQPVVIWVDASLRKPVETGSCDLDRGCADIVIDNNGALSDLPQQVYMAMAELGLKEVA